MIFVCGVSGSGKSHIISLVTDADVRWSHVKGSSILEGCKRPIRNLKQSEAKENQIVLRLELLKRNLISTQHILDGHITINTDDDIFIVPDWFFEAIPVQKIICIYDDPTSIAHRLERKGVLASINSIDAHQKIERREALARANALKCPYHELAAVDLDGFARTLEQ